MFLRDLKFPAFIHGSFQINEARTDQTKMKVTQRGARRFILNIILCECPILMLELMYEFFLRVFLMG